MVAGIVLLVPAVLSVWLYERLAKRELGVKKWIYRFGLNVLCINSVVFLLKMFLLKTGDAPLYAWMQDMTPAVAIRYLVMAVPTAAVVAALEILLPRHIRLDVEQEKE